MSEIFTNDVRGVYYLDQQVGVTHSHGEFTGGLGGGGGHRYGGGGGGYQSPVKHSGDQVSD